MRRLDMNMHPVSFIIQNIFKYNKNKSYIYQSCFKILLWDGSMKETPDTPVYKDKLFRGIACLLAAHMIVMMGRPDLTSHEIFLVPSYYPRLLANYAIALIVAFAVKKVTIALDRNHSWYRDVWRRAMLQFAYGVLAVSMLCYLLVLFYFYVRGLDMLASGYLHYERPFSVALITILNFYYVAYYFYMYPRQKPVNLQTGLLPVEQSAGPAGVQVPAAAETHMNKVPDSLAYSPSAVPPRKETKELLIIDTPRHSIPVSVADVLMFFIFERTVFVRMKGMSSLNDCYPVRFALMDLMAALDEKAFYRINRRCIINIAAIGAYAPADFQTLTIKLRKEYGSLENLDSKDWTKLMTVSEDRTPGFKKWINR